ncbi:hypothetical protein COP1_030938 [Malus domestica]
MPKEISRLPSFSLTFCSSKLRMPLMVIVVEVVSNTGAAWWFEVPFSMADLMGFGGVFCFSLGKWDFRCLRSEKRKEMEEGFRQMEGLRGTACPSKHHTLRFLMLVHE